MEKTQTLRLLPSVERMLLTPTAVDLSLEIGRERVRDALRNIIEELRIEFSQGPSSPTNGTGQAYSPDEIASDVEQRLRASVRKLTTPSLRRVVNATGVIIHTNLGRAPLAKKAIEAISEIGSGYSNLEYDLEQGDRGRRESHCQELIERLTGAESAIVANNNAAAVLLLLNTLAQGGEVIVSRGELIEIGGSFRIPDVMERSGALLREVGTTNRTRIADYASAITENTRLILRVHPSNYRIIGFTERPTVREIADLAARAGIVSFEDLGSGCLIDFSTYGIEGEPIVAESLKAGISVVSFSGDKMLGGPQAGIIAGSRAIIDRVRQNPLMRALRVDKLVYGALEATLKLYELQVADEQVPIVRAICTTREEIAVRAGRLCECVEKLGGFKASIEAGFSVVGGGSAPGAELPTALVAIEGSRLSASAIEAGLRGHVVPVIARSERNRVLIDLRTVMPDEEIIVLNALESIALGG
jgi:L-seryl-tRNA(Ser) seleniumtransferase